MPDAGRPTPARSAVTVHGGSLLFSSARRNADRLAALLLGRSSIGAFLGAPRDATPPVKERADERRYQLRCIDKLGYTFRGTETLLDCGCGNGGVARLLRERVREVVAIDVEPSPAWHDLPGLAFQVADAENLPFEDASFDVLHSKDSLHHMDSPERALADYRRVLKPGGTVLIVEANRYNPIFYPHMTLALGHEHFTRARLRSLVLAAFPEARLGAFEAHFVPGLDRFGALQHAIEEGLERLRPFRPLLSYNFAVAPR